ncbi:MAG TPA: ABC transporter permease [Blastocatellia bacterium]|nr:ABC transporter permease [Blastocatellia bacterium]
MQNLLKDLRYGIRLLMASPGFTAVAVISLALGIGANTAIFSVVRAFMFAPLPVEDAGRLVTISTTDVKNPGNLPTSYANYQDYRDKNEVFSGLTGFTFGTVDMNVGNGEAKQAFCELVSGNYFDVLGVKAALGRTFFPEEDKAPGSGPVIVLSYASWQRNFGGEAGIIGRTVDINRQPFTVIGVTPKDFTGTFLGGGPDFWVPMMMHDAITPGFDFYTNRPRRGLFVFQVARLKSGITVEQAGSAISIFATQLEQEYRADNEGRNVKLIPLLEARIDPAGDGQLKWTSFYLTGLALIVLVIACANVANLLLARAIRRKKEIAMRLAVGASRFRLIKQMMTESVLLAVLGGAAGLLVAEAGMKLLVSVDLLGGGGPNAPVPSLDSGALVFTVGMALFSSLVFGLAPSLQGSKSDLVTTLKGDVTVPASSPGLRLALRKALVVVQVALSLVTLITAALFVRSLRNAEAINPGFITDNMLIMGYDLGREGYTPAQGKVFQREVVDRVRAIPGVISATIGADQPFGGGFARSVFVEGQEPTQGGRGLLVRTNSVGLGFFGTLGIPLIAGRDFSESDSEYAPKVIVVNEAMANQFWPGQSAIGKRFKFFGDETYREIVGIAKDSKYDNLVEKRTPFAFIPMLQQYVPQTTLQVRCASEPKAFSGAIRDAVQGIDPKLNFPVTRTMRDLIDQNLAGQRSQTLLLTVFGLLALLLAVVGLYGVMAYRVAQRTREIGIRMALGAGGKNVLSLVLREGMILVWAGVGLGLVLSFLLSFLASRLLATLLFGVTATDLSTFLGVSALLVVVALAASFFPAQRATRVDPLIALRYD